MIAPLLTTKLNIPPTRPELAPRLRLIEQLNAGMARKLTLISTPAGFGKTTLLSEWVQEARGRMQDESALHPASCILHPSRVAWVSLDKGDNDPARFLAYFVAALQTIEANFGEDTLNVLQSPGLAQVTSVATDTPPAIETLITTLINQISAISDFILVLDDYHLITAQAIHDILTFLLDHLPNNMHLDRGMNK